MDANSGNAVATLTVKVERQHKKGCLGLNAVERGDWDFPWCFVGGMTYADKLGRRTSVGRGSSWMVFPCNDPGCDATLLVPTDELVEFVARQAS